LHFEVADWHAGNKFLEVNTLLMVLLGTAALFVN
jgi:hypothetical protein